MFICLIVASALMVLSSFAFLSPAFSVGANQANFILIVVQIAEVAVAIYSIIMIFASGKKRELMMQASCIGFILSAFDVVFSLSTRFFALILADFAVSVLYLALQFYAFAFFISAFLIYVFNKQSISIKQILKYNYFSIIIANILLPIFLIIRGMPINSNPTLYVSYPFWAYMILSPFILIEIILLFVYERIDNKIARGVITIIFVNVVLGVLHFLLPEEKELIEIDDFVE